MLITDRGVLVRTRVAEIRELGRATQGVTLIGLDDGSQAVGLQRIVENDAPAEGATESTGRQSERHRQRRRRRRTPDETNPVAAAALCAGRLPAPRAPASAARRSWSQDAALQQPGHRTLARSLVERRAADAAGRRHGRAARCRRTAARPSASRSRPMSASTPRGAPIVSDQAIKLAPTTIGALVEQKFSEDELQAR